MGAVTRVGIEKLRVYPCSLALDLEALCRARGRDPVELRETMMVDERSVNPPWEDPVTMAVNAADLLLADEDRRAIELLIVATESGVDQEKPISAWVHRHLGLSSSCRNFEVKHACYGGTAGLQMAAHWIAQAREGAKALVISTDESRMHLGKPWEYVLGAGAAAVLVSKRPRLVELELGASGFYSNEVSDLIRPSSRVETGDSETSLLSYLEAIEGAYDDYCRRTGRPADVAAHSKKIVYHVPFGGMTFLAHKTLLRRERTPSRSEAWADYEKRSGASLRYTRRMGGTYSASTFIALLGLVDGSDDLAPGDRVSVFSYGSGSCAEFYSVLVAEEARAAAREAGLARLLDERHRLSVQDYEEVERERTRAVDNGDFETRTSCPEDWYERRYRGRGLLVFRGSAEHYRRYERS